MAEIRRGKGNVQVGDFQGRHILVLDQDEYDLLMALFDWLSDAGYDSKDLRKLREDLEIY